MTPLQNYIQVALKKAKYSFDEESRSIVAVIEELPLCWAQGDTLQEAEAELASVIESWLYLRIQRGKDIPQLEDAVIRVSHQQEEFQYV